MNFDFNPIDFFRTLDWVVIIPVITTVVIWAGAIMLSILFLVIGLSFWLYWRRTKFKLKMGFVTFAIQIPPEDIKGPKAIENIIAQLYAFKSYFRFHEKWWKGQYILQSSLELVGRDGYVQFIVHVPRKYQILIERALYAQFPDAQMEEIEDYAQKIKPRDLVSEDKENGIYDMWGTEFVLGLPAHYPIRTYPLFVDASGKEFSDPLAAVIEMMSHLKRGEQLWYQITIAPTRKKWQERGMQEIRDIVEGNAPSSKKKGFSFLHFFLRPFFHGIYEILRVAMENITGSGAKPEETKRKIAAFDADERLINMVPPEYDLVVKAIREKISRLGFATYVRALYFAPKEIFESRRVTGDFIGIIRQFNNPQLNSFGSNRIIEVDYPQILFPKSRAKRRKKRLLRRAQSRYCGSGVDESSIFSPFQSTGTRNIMSIEEIATLWHFPNAELADKSGLLKRVLSKKVLPKQPVPEAESVQKETETQSQIDPNITFFASTNFRGMNRKFGIKREDRRRHMYVIGKTGMGKTTLLENMIYQDIVRGEGLAVLDPHGDLVDKIVDMIPPNRINDVVYFNPADQDFPVAFNILAEEDPQHRYLVVSSLVGIFKKIWADSWGPRLEYLLRNSLITLMEGGGNTILGVPRIFVDTNFRKKLINQIDEPVVKSFWLNEYAKYNQNFQVEAISPIQNKIGQFISIPLIRNMIGQVKSKIDFREILDQKKIFLVNLAKGLIGEDVSSLLGATIISKLQIAAMRRADIAEEKREDFYLYIDEFQNFSTESFATILSEARKYRLNLIMAHQYIEQLDEMVAAAVFGNVGSMICFGMGAEDAEVLEPHFAEEFALQDFVNLGKYETILRLMINGATSRPFSAGTLSPLGASNVSSRDKVVKVSRERYSEPRAEVEDKLRKWLNVEGSNQQTLPQGGNQNKPAKQFPSKTDFSKPRPKPATDFSKPRPKPATDFSKPRPKPATDFSKPRPRPVQPPVKKASQPRFNQTKNSRTYHSDVRHEVDVRIKKSP